MKNGSGRRIKPPAIEYIVKSALAGVKFHTEIVCKVVYSLVPANEATRFPTEQAAFVMADLYQLKPGTFHVEQFMKPNPEGKTKGTK